jgi:hypothetical protein
MDFFLISKMPECSRMPVRAGSYSSRFDMTHQEQAQPLAARIWLWVLGAALALAGLFFLIGGGKLISLGGSWYFCSPAWGCCCPACNWFAAA